LPVNSFRFTCKTFLF